MLIKKCLNFKSLPETVTLRIAIFQSRTEVVYKDPAVIAIQLLGAGLPIEHVVKSWAEIPSYLMAAGVMLLFRMSWNFTPVFTFFVGYGGEARR